MANSLAAATEGILLTSWDCSLPGASVCCSDVEFADGPLSVRNDNSGKVALSISRGASPFSRSSRSYWSLSRSTSSL